MKLGMVEKDKQPSFEILNLFEKVRVAYLSARQDPKEYGGRWRKAVELIEETFEDLDAAGKEIKNYVSVKELKDDEVNNPESSSAKTLYESVKMLRYASDLVDDPFARRFKYEVLEELLSNPESMVKFVHYALRNDDKPLPDEVYEIKDMKPDAITQGLTGLDLESGDIALYIIEHYGDGKDSKRVEKEVNKAMEMLELLMLSRYKEEDLDELKDIEKSNEEKSETEKSLSDFIVPNKPMYRIFDIKDIEELKGFSGEWYVQEKYDGMRIQLHKIDNSIKVFSYNKKNITDKCKDIVKELKDKHFGSCILDAELILFDNDEPLHRADTISHVFKNKYKDATLKCHVFDIMRHDEQNLLDEELQDRMTILFNNYSIHSSDILNFPSKKDTRQADNLKDIDEYAKKIMEMPTSEGVVIKDATSTYYVGTRKNPKWIKWKKFVDLDVIVLDKSKTKSNLYSYTLGISTNTEEGKFIEELQGKRYMNVGKALNTKTNVDVGSIVRVQVDEVKKTGERYTLFSAKVIEVPEVEEPDKEVTLELLSQGTKKSLNYSIEALKKGVRVTDHIHGEATVIIKSNMDGFTIYGFEEDNLMSKNALKDIDMWKAQAEEIMKTKRGKLTVAIFDFLKRMGAKTVKEVHNYLVEKQGSLYEDILDSQYSELQEWAEKRDGIEFENKKLFASPSKIMASEEIKKYKTPDEYRNGEFKIYLRKDSNINIVMKLGDDSINWLVDLQDEEELFDMFGKAGKYPAEVAKTFDREKVIDSGSVELGVQRHGYHEYFLKGNKFETKLHIRVIPVKGNKMWLAWTGFEQKPVEKDTDDGIWNIYEDKNNDLRIPREE
tara:strand:+ start:4867 stop:7374 length:2508 start_codon:yes stop_codon:yes gene_type:complete